MVYECLLLAGVTFCCWLALAAPPLDPDDDEDEERPDKGECE